MWKYQRFLWVFCWFVAACSSQTAEPVFDELNQENLTKEGGEAQVATRSVTFPTPIPTPGPAEENSDMIHPSKLIEENSDFIKRMQADLAERIGVNIDTIQLVSFEPVDWSDGGLGCAQPGMVYLQVITPGYRAIFLVDGQRYQYHTQDTTHFVLCERDGGIFPVGTPAG